MPGAPVPPYLLRGVEITRSGQAWSTDITRLPMRRGFMYLVAMDWFSRHVLAWQFSNTPVARFCLEALHTALAKGRPEIVNTDRGVHFTANAFFDLEWPDDIIDVRSTHTLTGDDGPPKGIFLAEGFLRA